VKNERLADFASRLFVGVLFVFLSVNLLSDFMETHRVTGLLFLVSESLVVVLTIVRRRAAQIDRSATGRLITGISLAGPPLLRTSTSGAAVPDDVTALISVVGLCLVISGKLTLGRSFGLMPANRGVVDVGPYLLVRHPIYTGYLITHVAFLIAHPRPLNLAIVIVSDAALVVRALFEERVLGRDERYRDYCRRVAWHLVPGVF
jgi:protein-S-isoprenylcysteine O-methyltransferase Ste14